MTEPLTAGPWANNGHPRANAQSPAETIDLVLIGHFDTHREALEAKIRAPLGSTP